MWTYTFISSDFLEVESGLMNVLIFCLFLIMFCTNRKKTKFCSMNPKIFLFSFLATDFCKYQDQKHSPNLKIANHVRKKALFLLKYTLNSVSCLFWYFHHYATLPHLMISGFLWVWGCFYFYFLTMLTHKNPY